MATKKKYSVEIDARGSEGPCDLGQWVCYGTIIAEGSTLDELLDDATVDLVDQDGGEFNIVKADEPWMQALIEEEYLKRLARKIG